MIGTGVYYRGPEHQTSRIAQMLEAAGEVIDQAAGEWHEGDFPAVILLFVVPGTMGDVDFAGQRVTLFSRKKKLLQIEVAIPKELLSAQRIDDFVIETLRQASVTAAAEFDRKKAGIFDLAKANAIIEEVRRLLATQRPMQK